MHATAHAQTGCSGGVAARVGSWGLGLGSIAEELEMESRTAGSRLTKACGWTCLETSGRSTQWVPAWPRQPPRAARCSLLSQENRYRGTYYSADRIGPGNLAWCIPGSIVPLFLAWTPGAARVYIPTFFFSLLDLTSCPRLLSWVLSLSSVFLLGVFLSETRVLSSHLPSLYLLFPSDLFRACYPSHHQSISCLASLPPLRRPPRPYIRELTSADLDYVAHTLRIA